MDYKDTLNLPRTGFPMKANLPQKEIEITKFWEEMDIYRAIRNVSSGRGKYILHDGPPYANGHIHIGHALNKTLKDIIIKYKTMRGFDCNYIPGWDCHGLPVEHQLFKELNITKYEIPQVKFRKKAYDYAINFVNIQREEFKRLGVFGNWSNPYLTIDRRYEAAIVRSFAKLVEGGYIYKGKKPVNYCYKCETALAEAEVEYEDHTSPSVYVKFKLADNRQLATNGPLLKFATHILIWTTTPWTLIANIAVAVHPDFEYAVVKIDNDAVIIARPLLERIAHRCSLADYNVIETVKGKDLQGLVYEHPFGFRKGEVVLGDYVSMEEGTGCVHTAPGHGEEDYITALKYKLPIIMPVDEKGNFTEEAGEFKGLNVIDANPVIIKRLKEINLLLHHDKITHSYPHCWRCKNPIIFRATEQWFMSVEHNELRKRLLDEIKKVKWIPVQGEERISAMVELRPDWCLSRQRYWGVPIPVFMCKFCNVWIADAKLIEDVARRVEERGTDVWFEMDIKELLTDGYRCPECNQTELEKGHDIIDVWFDSGVSHQAVLKGMKDLSYPCDLYLEGSDQHRGWFQAAIITSMAIDGHAPFKSVLTHGFVVDGEGRKMSKSLGNVISPQEIIKDYGADILRLWVTSSDYNDDVRISDKILARLIEAYRKVRNTARFILGNLYDFDPEKDHVSYESLLEIDRWAISRAHNLLIQTGAFYDDFQFHKVYHCLYNFCVTDMSNFYLDILKDRLYTFKPGSLERCSCQTAIYEVLNVLVTTIAPVLVFTAEEIWQNMPWVKKLQRTVHLIRWPDIGELKIDTELELRWQRLIEIRDMVLKVLEGKRISGIIGSSLEAKVVIYIGSEEAYSFLKGYEKVLPEIFIVSQAEIKNAKKAVSSGITEISNEFSIVVDKADGEKCARCWNYNLSVGKDRDYPNICQRCQKVLKGL